MPNVLGTPEDLNASTIGDSTAAAIRPPHALPESIGPYRIIECIGEGGMGIVYKAEQREPVRRIVALKIIKLGMDTKEVVARFDVERQALAVMSHPNVAKVFDAGMTETGRPYFAMEHVPGVAITSYCDTNKLTTRERLELFIPVCQAVQHAHQKGIIHRDLKPGNILVTMFDGKPVPKVIDFGVAKATNFHLTEKTLFTQTGSIIGTVEYMSPEQATGSGLDIDTRTDIYSLGVILYQLLTGTLPFESETLRKVNMDEMARIICDIDPPKPSARLTQTLRAARRAPGATAIAKLHHTDPRGLRRELQGDLDWIVLKAMEKDRTRRYETANGLVMDLQRHLADEPVSACPPSAGYRLRKFARRHRTELVAGTAIALTLLIGVIASTYAVIQKRIADVNGSLADQKQLEANAANRTAERVSSLFEDVLTPVSADGIRRTPVQVLDEAAQRLQRGAPEGERVIEARLRTVLGRRYVAIGLYQRAIPPFRAALDRNVRLYGADSPELLVSLNELADALVTNDDLPEAEPVLAQARSIEDHMTPDDKAARAWTLDLTGSVLAGQGNWTNAAIAYREAFDLRDKTPGDTREMADSLAHQADVLLHNGDQSGNGVLKRAKEMYARVFAFHPLGTIGPLRRMARSAARRGEWQVADEMALSAGFVNQPMDPKLLGEWISVVSARLAQSPTDLELLMRRGPLDGRQGQFDAALADYTRILQLDPSKVRLWHWALPLYLQTNQADRYVQARHVVLNDPRLRREPPLLHQIAKSALCYRIDGDDLIAAGKMAEEALRMTSPPGKPFSLEDMYAYNLQNLNPFYLQSMGMAEFRAGHFQRAIDLFKASRDHVYLERDALANFYIAMAYAGLNDYDQARSLLRAGIHIWDTSARKPGVDDLEQFQDWIICSLARDEAVRTIDKRITAALSQ